MTQRNETLAAAFEQVTGQILTVVDGLSDVAWDVTLTRDPLPNQAALFASVSSTYAHRSSTETLGSSIS
jgi:hypothetical protein